MSRDYALRPAPRVSFATHDSDADAAFKDEVAGRVRRARWNTYVGVDQSRAAADFARHLGFDGAGIDRGGARRASLHRGAEAALRSLVEHRAPRRLWAPAHGYPGFARVAASQRIPLLSYAGPEDLAQSGAGDLVVVTTPSSPIAAGDAVDLVRVAERSGALGVVDATFSLLDPDGVAALGALSNAADAPLIVSLSKSLGLAAVRLGILIDREGGPDVVPNPMELDVLQCAVWETLMDCDNLQRRARAVGERQRMLHHRLLRALERGEAEVLYASNSFAITVRAGTIPESVLGPHGWKEYPRLSAIRLDASERVVDSVEAWAGAHR